jgi:molecular chaperone DnaJ
MAENKDLYEVLGISKDADEKTIKNAYRKIALKYHPDRQEGKSESEKQEAEQKFKEASSAYEVLSDKDKRQRYDTFGTVDGQDSGFGGFDGFDFGGFDFGGFRGNPFDFPGWGSNSDGGRKQRQVKPGQSIQMEIPLTIEDIYNGCTKKVKYNINVRCPECHGNGGETKTCSYCGGTGMHVETTHTPFGFQQVKSVCQHCHGTGEEITKKCPHCHGTGFVKKEKTTEVNFPAGIISGNGNKYSFQGSESSSPDGQNGDFIAYAKWNFDENIYSINGSDITQNIYIPYEDAILGTTYHLVLPNNRKKDIKISKGTEPGKKLRIPSEGIKDMNGYRGSYIICVNYKLSDNISEEEIKLLEQIKKLHNN